MRKTLTEIYFDNRFSFYDIFVLNKKAILIHKNTMNMVVITEEEYLKVLKWLNLENHYYI